MAGLGTSRGRRVRPHRHPQHPEYIYNLVHHFADEVPDGGVVDATGDAVAAVVEDYRGLGTTSQDGLVAMEELIGWVPSRGGVANLGQMRLVPFPSTVTHYVSADAVWERKVMVLDATYLGEYANLWAPRRTFRGGTKTRDTWFGGPVGSRVSPLQSVTNGAPPPVRENGWLYFSQAPSPMRQGTTATPTCGPTSTQAPSPSTGGRSTRPTGPCSSTSGSRPGTTTSWWRHVHTGRTLSGSSRLTSGPVGRSGRSSRRVPGPCCPCWVWTTGWSCRETTAHPRGSTASRSRPDA